MQSWKAGQSVKVASMATFSRLLAAVAGLWRLLTSYLSPHPQLSQPRSSLRNISEEADQTSIEPQSEPTTAQVLPSALLGPRSSQTEKGFPGQNSPVLQKQCDILKQGPSGLECFMKISQPQKPRPALHATTKCDNPLDGSSPYGST